MESATQAKQPELAITASRRPMLPGIGFARLVPAHQLRIDMLTWAF